MTIATGWAVQNPDGSIDIRTVMDTERGAKVNWLVTVPKVMIFNFMQDEEIDEIWKTYRERHTVTPVTITPHRQ